MRNVDHDPEHPLIRFNAVRPLVRYVDEDQAVIETHFAITNWPAGGFDTAASHAMVLVEIQTAEGFHDEQHTRISLNETTGMIRLQLVHPNRWWPAGMGEQPLYELVVSLWFGDEVVDRRESTIGLTSVRCASKHQPAIFLINGKERAIHSVVPVDLADERHLLPVAGDSLIVVRGHYGPDLLYHAADRAGLMVVQCVPIDPQGQPETSIEQEVNRLAMHPSLAGWFVGHLGHISDRIEQHLRRLDPAHNVFHHIPTLPHDHAA